jgi:hypothetical protein
MSDKTASSGTTRSPQQLIDEIRFRLQSDQQTRTLEMSAMAREYAALCRMCNDRLRDCENSLKKGLFAEAAHLADREPNLLDLVALADFSERPEWVSLVGLYDLDEPQPLLIDIAQALNEAYTRSLSDERLLARHRLLALARAPLWERAQTLRDLLARDPANGFWEEDLRAMERAWFQQVESEIETASRRMDVATLRGIATALESRELQEPAPSGLVRTARQRLALAARHQARKELTLIEPLLNDALNSLDRGRGLMLRQKWLQNLPAAQLAADDPVLQQVSPVLMWLADGDAEAAANQAYQQAVQVLEQAIDTGKSSVSELEQLAMRVVQTGLPLSDITAHRYSHAVAAARLRALRKSQMTVAAIGAVVLVVSLGVAGLVLYLKRIAAIQAFSEQFKIMVEADNLKGAEKLVDDSKAYSSSKAWIAAQKELQLALKKEGERAEQFASELGRAQQLAGEKPKDALLVLSAATAKTKDEQDDKAGLEDTLRKQIEAVRKQLESDIGKLVSSLSDRLKAAEEPGTDDDASLAAKQNHVDESKPDLNKAKELARGAESRLQAEVNNLADRFRSLENRISGQRKRLEIMGRLTLSSKIAPGTPNLQNALSDYDKALQDYSKEFPEDGLSRSGSFKKEVDLWMNTLQARRLVEKSPGSLFPDGHLVALRFRELGEQIIKLEGAPDLPLLKEYRTLLESVGFRSQGPGGEGTLGARAKLVAMLDDRIVKDSLVVVVKDRTLGEIVYYLDASKPVPSLSGTGQVTLQYMTGYSDDARKPKLISDPKDLLTKKVTKSPQALLRETHIDDIKNPKDDLWLVCTQALASDLINAPDWKPDGQAIDPLLRYRLLRGLVQHARQGHAFLSEALESRAAVLQDPDLDIEALWMDPKDQAGDKARLRAQRVLRNAKSLEEAWPQAMDREKKLSAEMLDHVEAIGWLYRKSPDSPWEIRTGWEAKGSVTLQVVIPGEADVASRWETIGTINGSMKTLNPGVKPECLREGRLIFGRHRPKR